MALGARSHQLSLGAFRDFMMLLIKMLIVVINGQDHLRGFPSGSSPLILRGKYNSKSKKPAVHFLPTWKCLKYRRLRSVRY